MKLETQMGRLSYIFERELLFLWQILDLLLRPSPDSIRPTHTQCGGQCTLLNTDTTKRNFFLRNIYTFFLLWAVLRIKQQAL